MSTVNWNVPPPPFKNEIVSSVMEAVYKALVSTANVNAKRQLMDVSNLTTGTYLIQLHTDTGVITKRVIIK